MPRTIDDATRRRLHANKDLVLENVTKALRDAGLGDSVEVQSICLHLKRMPPQCPAGQEPVFEIVTKRDGTVVYEWVCK